LQISELGQLDFDFLQAFKSLRIEEPLILVLSVLSSIQMDNVEKTQNKLLNAKYY